MKYILHADSHKMRYWVTHPSRAASKQLGGDYRWLFIASDRTDANGLECTAGISAFIGKTSRTPTRLPIRCTNCDPHGLSTVFGYRYGRYTKKRYGSGAAVWLWGTEHVANRLGDATLTFNAAPFKP